MRSVAGPDAAFLYGERPEWHFHVSALLVLDPSTSDRFSFEELRSTLARRLHLVPQFRWKLVEAPLRLGFDLPIWVDDPDFDLDKHLHRIGVPKPGDDRALSDLVGMLVGVQLDREVPLWEGWLIEGLHGGRLALLMKIHHSIIDGASGAEMATLLFDLDANAPTNDVPPTWTPERMPSNLERLAGTAGRAVLWPLHMGRLAQQLVRQGVTMGRNALSERPAAQPFGAPRTMLNGRLTPRRSFATAEVSLAAAKKVKKAFDVTVNDVVLTITGGALRSYLEKRGGLPDRPLIAQVPVSMRDQNSTGTVGTKVAAMFMSLGTHIENPVERLLHVHESSASAKEMRQTLSAQHVINFTDATAPAVIGLAARLWTAAGMDERVPPVFNLIVSNVSGPPMDLFIAGARIVAMYPMGPLLYGSGLNLTVISDAHHLNFGLMVCPDLVPDPWDIAARIPPALDELVAAIAK